MSSSNIETYTLTFGDCAENHRDMQIIGEKLSKGLSKEDLLTIQEYFEKTPGVPGERLGLLENTQEPFKTELIHLNELITEKAEDAYILIIKNGLKCFVDTDDLFEEQKKLEKDKKAFMYGRVVNKKARHNLCFSDFSQEPDYENKKGTVYNFKDLPLLNTVREKIGNLLPNKTLEKLQCEGNYYYDIKKTYIGFHSDLERKIVIAIRLGADFPLFYQWYYKSKPIGKLFKYTLEHGDIYIMSGKAVGYDGRKKNIPILRHAAGFESALKI